MKILLVDDEKDILEQAKIFLERKEKLKAETITSPKEALKNLVNGEFDAIVYDYQMPGMNGLEFLRVVREEKKSDIPFIIFTGKGREEVAMKALNLGANRYLRKGGDPVTQYEVLAGAIIDEVEHKRAEKRAESYARDLKETFNSLQEIAFLLDEDHNIILANGHAEKFFGKSEEELKDFKCYELAHGTDEPIEGCPLKKTFDSREMEELDFYDSNKGKYFLARTHPIFTGEGEPEKFVHQVIDITKRKKKEEDLKIYKDRLETAMEAGNLAWWEMELPSGKVRFNDRKAEMLGYSPGRFEHYEDFTDLLHPEDHDKAMHAMRDHLEGRAPRYEVEYRIKMKSGDYKWLRDVGAITEDSESNDYRKVTGVVIDIDERKKKEEKLQFQSDILEQIENAVIVTNLEGKVTYWNKKAEELYGWKEEEVLGENIVDVTPSLASKDQAEEIMEKLQKGEKWSDEFLVQRKDGTEFNAIVTDAPIYNEDGEITGIVGVSTDISKRKELEEREKFLHSLLRHDVRNKMQIVQGYLELLKDFDLPKEAESFLEKAMRSSYEGMEVIEKVRTLRKASEEETKSVNICSMIYDSLDNWKSWAEDAGMEINVDFPESKCVVKGGSLLNELFSNLVENSIQHSGGEIIEISGEIIDSEFVCVIEDNGQGIADENKDRIFDKGYTTDEGRGSGLGLFLVKALLDIYGGDIEVGDSELGGAKFEIRLKMA